MLEPGGVLGLAHGALAHVVALGFGKAWLGEDLLDRDGAFQSLIDGAPYDPHGTATYVLDKAIVPCDQLTGLDDACSSEISAMVALLNANTAPAHPIECSGHRFGSDVSQTVLTLCTQAM
jgi:hypothetical protein